MAPESQVAFIAARLSVSGIGGRGRAGAFTSFYLEGINDPAAKIFAVARAYRP